LKLEEPRELEHHHLVAPFTGAWIETEVDVIYRTIDEVAPFTGAWIETCRTAWKWRSADVAPFTGAWIETRRPRG